MEIWKIVFHFILEVFHSIPFWHLPYRNFRSFPFSISYHALVVDSILLLLRFTPTVLARLKIRKHLILKKLLPLLAPFQHFRFRFQPLSSKCFRFHKKLTASTVFASSLRFHFHMPASKRVRLGRGEVWGVGRFGEVGCLGREGLGVCKMWCFSSLSSEFTPVLTLSLV